MDVSLREFLEAQVEALDQRYAAELASMREAILLARHEMERRLSELNQLRKEVIDDRDQLVRKETFDPAYKDITKELNQLSDKLIDLANANTGNEKSIESLRGSLGWLARLVVGAVILALIAFGFRALTGR